MADTPSPRQRSDGFVERSQALAQMRRLKDAAAHARRAVEADPTHVRARMQLAQVQLSMGHLDDAARLAEGALAQEPTSSWALRMLSACRLATGRHAEAVALAEEAVRQSQGDALSMLSLSSTRSATGDLAGARAMAERLVEKYPDWPDGFVRLAETRHSPEETDRAYREALRLDPQHDEALAGLAVTSASFAKYQQAVSLAWSSLQTDVADRARQRYFARSAWIYLALSRIATPLRGVHRALAEPFGESCARAFLATGPSTAGRLWFAFRRELIAVAVWLGLLGGMAAAMLLPDDIAGVGVILLGIPVFLGLFAPLVVGFRGIAAARRLVDARLVRWGGSGSLKSILARALVSGAMLVFVALGALLAWPLAPGPWGWLLMLGVVLGVQDLSRWRDQWRDRQLAGHSSSLRERVGAWLSHVVQRRLTPRRLLLAASTALAIDVALDGLTPYAGVASLPLVTCLPLAALLACAIQTGARRLATRHGPGARADRWGALGRAMLDGLWLLTVASIATALGSRLLKDLPVEAMWPILLFPFILTGGWLAARTARAAVSCAASELSAGARGIGRRFGSSRVNR